MMGTFATLLAKKRIPTPPDRYRAHVRGAIEDVDGVLKITRIDVRYQLTLAPGQRQDAQDCFAAYLPHCPAAQSVIGAIDIFHFLEMEDR